MTKSLDELIALAASISSSKRIESTLVLGPNPEINTYAAIIYVLETALGEVQVTKASKRYVPSIERNKDEPMEEYVRRKEDYRQKNPAYTDERYAIEIPNEHAPMLRRSTYTSNYLRDDTGRLLRYFPTTKIKDYFDRLEAQHAAKIVAQNSKAVMK